MSTGGGGIRINITLVNSYFNVTLKKKKRKKKNYTFVVLNASETLTWRKLNLKFCTYVFSVNASNIAPWRRRAFSINSNYCVSDIYVLPVLLLERWYDRAQFLRICCSVIKCALFLWMIIFRIVSRSIANTSRCLQQRIVMHVWQIVFAGITMRRDSATNTRRQLWYVLIVARMWTTWTTV